MAVPGLRHLDRVSRLPAFRALRYRDFRLLWVGAFFSFLGSQVQNVAQGFVVFELTHDSAKLAMVSFAMMLPVSVFGPVLGVVSDMMDKRKVLVACMALSAVGPVWLGITTLQGRAAYWHFLAVAFVAGLVQCVEVPTRQSVVRSVVAEEDLAAAIPAQASTFNLARVAGPVLGAGLTATLGAAVCFLFNGLSYFALAIAAVAIKTDLRPVAKRAEPIKDLVLEGVRYTLRHPSLRILFLLECATSVLGTFYLALIAAIADVQLGLGAIGLGILSSCVGVGALTGLLTIASLSQKPYKRTVVLASMTTMAVCLVLLGFVRVPALGYAICGLMGAATIMQFNTTNTLFQLIAPAPLRGRVVSMHMWAISGVAPVGFLLLGHLAQWRGIPVALWTAGALLTLASLWGWSVRGKIVEPVLVLDDGAA